MSDFGSVALRRLHDAFPDALLGSHADVGDATATLDPGQLVPVMRFLRDDEATAFEMLMDLTAVDHLGRREPRFEVVYHLYSVARGHRLRVKVAVAESAPEVASLCPVWPAANWMEREVWDLYGIRFDGHPDLRRLLLYEEFEGHPLRKDYPKTGRQPLIGPRD
ncbi:MAG: NADH-quinone oxidoreductase subunit C [Myxococcota bacterium]